MFQTVLLVVLIDCSLSSSFEGQNVRDQETADKLALGEDSRLGFQNYYQQANGRQGQHGTENNQNVYAQEDGRRGIESNKNNYLRGFLQKENGKSGLHFNETGRYAKGHNTKGNHNIHKLKELKKDTDFYDNLHDGFEENRRAGYERQKNLGHGNVFGKIFLKSSFKQDELGVGNFADKGSNLYEDFGLKLRDNESKFASVLQQFAKNGKANNFQHLITEKPLS